MQFASANTHELKWVLVIAHLILKVCNDHIFLIVHMCAYALFLILFEGFVKKAWKWHRLNSTKRLGGHILPEMCVQFSSTKLSSTRWIILHRIPQV